MTMPERQDHQCISPHSAEWAQVLQRLKDGDERMGRIEDNTAEMVAAFKAAQGAFKALDFLGRVAKPFLWLAALSTAIYTFWLQVKAAVPLIK
jgi:hypothetical protein